MTPRHVLPVRPRTVQGWRKRQPGLRRFGGAVKSSTTIQDGLPGPLTIDAYRNTIVCCDALTLARSMPSQSIQTIITSPPYFGLRDYQVDGQIGLEDTPEAYIARLVELFRELRRALRDDGTLWLNLGDSYARVAGDDSTKISDSGMKTGRTGKSAQLFKAGINRPPAGLKPKDLIGIPWRVALALQADGWYLRADIIWHKPNPMPESVTDRPTKAHEYVFLLSKNERYYYDSEAIKEPAQDWGSRGRRDGKYTSGVVPISGGPHKGLTDGDFSTRGRNKRSVWAINTKPFADAHFAVFPEELIEPMVLAGSRPGDIVYDPFMGSGTTALVARKHKRDYIGSELNPDYADMATDRLRMPFEKRKRLPKSEPVEDLPLFAMTALAGQKAEAG